MGAAVTGKVEEEDAPQVPEGDFIASSDTSTLFETGNYLDKIEPVEFTLKEVEKLTERGLWLRYEVKKRKEKIEP